VKAHNFVFSPISLGRKIMLSKTIPVFVGVFLLALGAVGEEQGRGD
jgi:hypothetical protein